MGSRVEPFGVLPDGRTVHRYRLHGTGIDVDVLDWGGIVQSVRTVGASVALGLSTLQEYLESDAFFGAIIGRVANRIDAGRFTIDGVEHRVPVNDPPASLHGGREGWDRKLWAVAYSDAAVLELHHRSPEGDEGYPGQVDAIVRYDVLRPGTLRMLTAATTTAPTLVNVTNHSYWNLHGAGAGTVLDHELTVPARHYLPLRDDLIPTGVPAAVAGTRFDFGRARLIDEPYDHNFLIEGTGLRLAARVRADGRTLEVFATEPAIDLYTGNFLTGAPYARYGGLAIEPGMPSNYINTEGWRDRVLRPGDRYASTIEFRFS